jgi:chromate reductase, NAD(P)H dehydrogenase (quinone)
MPLPKILVFAGSLRAGSYNARLAALAAKELTLADAEVTRISLADYPLPVYDADHESRSGPPLNAIKLKQVIAAHQGVFIATPEYNASITPLVKNSIDWITRVRERDTSGRGVFKNRVFALGSASTEHFGGMRSLLTLRQVLEVGCGALVIPEQVSIVHADEAFDERDNLKDARLADQLREVAQALVEMARQLA